MLMSARRGETLTPNPNECNFTPMSGTNNIYPCPYIDVNDWGHCFRSGSPLRVYPAMVAADLQISIQKDSRPSEFSRPLTSITLNLNGICLLAAHAAVCLSSLLSLLLALAPLPLNNSEIIPVFRNLLTEKFSKNCWYNWNNNLQSREPA